MCRAGGPRCYSHAIGRVNTTASEAREATEALDRLLAHPSYAAAPRDAQPVMAAESRARVTQARAAHRDALVDLAASNGGAPVVTEMLTTDAGLTVWEGQSILLEAQWRIRRGQLVRAAVSPAGLRSVLGQTGDPEDDRLVQEAAHAVVAAPAEHSKPVDTFPEQVEYPSRKIMRKAIDYRIRCVHDAASAYRVARERLRLVEQDTSGAVADALRWAQEDVRNTAIDLTVHAQYLATANRATIASRFAALTGRTPSLAF